MTSDNYLHSAVTGSPSSVVNLKLNQNKPRRWPQILAADEREANQSRLANHNNNTVSRILQSFDSLTELTQARQTEFSYL